MKRFSFLFLISVLTSIIISSCSNTVTYAEQLKAEKELIASYIKRNNINVLKSFPQKGVKWGDNDYVKTSSGLYFHLVDSGEVNHAGVAINDIVIPRYKEYNLEEISVLTKSNWSTIEYPHPGTFTYGSAATIYTGFQEAVGYMKYNNSEAKVIIPSKIGFYYADTSAATPYFYDLKIMIKK